MNMDNVMASLKIMGIGMVTIFVVILLIMLVVVMLTKLTGSKPEKKDDQTQN